MSWRGIVDTIRLPGIGLLVLLGFLAILAFGSFEGTFAVFLGRRPFKWDAQKAAFAFAGLGFLSAAVQGGLIRRLVPRLGETKLIVSGFLLAACGFAGLSQAGNVPGLIVSLALLGVGQGLVGPSISGLLSRRTPASEQGAVFGTLTSAQTLARMISYSAGNLLLGKVSIVAPYWGALGIDVVGLAIAVRSALLFRRETTSEPVEKVKG